MKHRTLALLTLLAISFVALCTELFGVHVAELELVPCPLLSLSGHPCPGCGMTRACTALATGQPGVAWQYHPMAFLLIPLVATYAISPAGSRRIWRSLGTVGQRLTLLSLLGVSLSIWVSKLA